MASTPSRIDGPILGLHVSGCQSSAALYLDGTIIAAVAEERLNRQKRSRAFPHRAVAWCLAQAGLKSLDEVARIVTAWNPGNQMRAINMSGFTEWRRYDPEWLYIVPNQLAGQFSPPESDASIFDFSADNSGRFIFLSHHLAHMGWAYASPFEQAAVAVVDEYGESASLTYGIMRGNRVERIAECGFPNSLGVFYSAMTAFIGFTPNSDEWKVMGASAYGDPKRYSSKVAELIGFEDGELVIDQRRIEFANMRKAGYFGPRLEQFLGVPARHPAAPFEQQHMDLAAAVQAVFEERLFQCLRWLQTRTGRDALVLGGGCAMNSLANGRILANTDFKHLFVPPAPADNGNSIGAALHTAASARDADPIWRVSVSPFLGPAADNDQVEAVLRRCRLPYKRLDDTPAATARLVSEGKIVGWVQGAMEFGERALGGRSILADPRDPTMKDRVNLSIKYREAFRPFAPSVPAERADAYFDLPPGVSVPYMEQVYPIRENQRDRIPAVVHKDGTGRLQTVDRDVTPRYHQLLLDFESITGIPVILNTSFNLNGEPIVNTPEDALRTFFTSGLDALVIGDFLVTK